MSKFIKKKSKFRASKCVNIADFALLKSPILIKIKIMKYPQCEKGQFLRLILGRDEKFTIRINSFV